MYAIFEAKGKQWRAEEGATLELPSLDAEPGERVVFDRVLLAERDGEVLVGRPTLQDASVAVEVSEHGKGDKIVVFKRKRRKNYRRKYGHRQPYTEVRVVELDLDGATAPAPDDRAAEEGAPGEEPRPEDPGDETGERATAAAAPEPEAGEELDVTDAAGELAEEHDVDLATIEGTGEEGRILKSDVQDVVDDRGGDAEPDEEEDGGAEGGTPPDVDITAAAEELAAEHDVDVTAIEGTGKDGRILKSDVEAAIEEAREE